MDNIRTIVYLRLLNKTVCKAMVLSINQNHELKHCDLIEMFYDQRFRSFNYYSRVRENLISWKNVIYIIKSFFM